MLVAFPFAQNDHVKLRPAIVVNTDLPEALLVLFVTSQNTFSTAYDLVLEPSRTRTKSDVSCSGQSPHCDQH